MTDLRPPSRKLHIKTYGCQMNVYDSARMADLLAPLGFAASDTAEDADLVILNTCHIREKAAEKVYSDLGRLRPAKARKHAAGGRMMVAVAGCVAQAEGAEIRARAPEVDIVLGPQTYHRLPEMVARAARQDGLVLETDFPAEAKFDFLPETNVAPGVGAFLSIQEGCDKFCTFCVVPYTRGAEYSRPPRGDPRRGAAPGRTGRARAHAPGPERQRLPPRRLGLGPIDPRRRRDSRPRAHPLHHLASTRRR